MLTIPVVDEDRVVAMTADARAETRARCLDAGMDDFVTKPIRRGDVEAILGRWLPGPPVSAHMVVADGGHTVEDGAIVDLDALEVLRQIDPVHGAELVRGCVAEFLRGDIDVALGRARTAFDRLLGQAVGPTMPDDEGQLRQVS